MGIRDETEIALRNGWLYTGDIAWKDNDGYYFIKGRKKDLIKVGGLQVWPQEVEEVISLLPSVKESTAAGIPDDYLGEVVYAWVVKKPESQPDRAGSDGPLPEKPCTSQSTGRS